MPQGTTLDALFVYASKVAHSCRPNTAYTSKTKDGCLEYKLIRPVSDGELVTFSYLEKLFVTPTHRRRNKLLESKSFVCKCQRCMGPDFCRFLRCLTPTCNKFMTCANQGEGVTTWSCPSCGDIDKIPVESQTKKEKLIESELTSLKMQAMCGLSKSSITSAKALAKKASVQLSPVHFLALMALEHCATLCASLAAQSEQMAMMGLVSRNGAVSLRLQAAEFGFIFVSSCECVATGCNGKLCSVEDVEAHDPLYECTTEIFHACQDLMNVPRWPTRATLMAKRYLPNMRVCFGEDDTDVFEIERKVNSNAVAEVSPATCYGSSTKLKTTSNRSGKKNRKKNRKKNHGKKK